MHIKINNDIDKKKWENFVHGHAHGNAFQTPAMYDFFASVRNYMPLVIACLDEGDRIQGLLLAVCEKEREGFWGRFSSRAIAYGGPLLAETADDNVLKTILHTFVDALGRKTVYLEIRNLFDFSNMYGTFEQQGFAFNEHLNYRVSTDTIADPKRKFSSNRIRQIKKSLASGTYIEEVGSLDQVAEFQRILTGLYREKVRKPLPDRSFFENFFLAGKKLGVMLLVRFGGKTIGGIMCPIHRGRVIYEWYVCGLDSEFPDQSPSVMATWAAIEYARKNGFDYFDFMGAGAPDRDYGVRDFKARFGGELVNYGRLIRINNKFLFLIGKVGLKILGILKKI